MSGRKHIVAASAGTCASPSGLVDAALIFEGGAMRNAYTVAVVEALLSAGITFKRAYGISAGAVLAVDYVACDAAHARAVFTDSVLYPQAGGVRSFLAGRGFFDNQFVFEGLAEMNAGTGEPWDFDFHAFRENPADVHIEAFSVDTGQTVAWTKRDMHTLTDVMERVAASCSYPLFTDSTLVDGVAYVDGGMGQSHGICLEAARRDGFTHFFVVRTQPQDYRMRPLGMAKRIAYALAYRAHPAVYRALCARPAAYNALLDELDELERQGIAYVFCPDTMPITYKTTNRDRLLRAFELGREQCARELPVWRAWISTLR